MAYGKVEYARLKKQAAATKAESKARTPIGRSAFPGVGLRGHGMPCRYNVNSKINCK